ncbi:SDR family NAD(P)-dependent oxidoreductase [Paenibacillus sp. FSL H8-0259]|nr:hypothetical protein BK132_16360 [Paenibacillus sp. FSL H8-0259]
MTTTEFRFQSDHPILAHHQVMGSGILPGLAYIDICYQWFREQGYDCAELELRQVTLFRPVTVRENEEIRLQLHCVEAQKGQWQIRVEGEITGTEEESAGPFMTAEMHRCPPVRFEHSVDADRIRSLAGSRTDMALLYEQCRALGLVHSGFMKAEGRLFDEADSLLLDLDLPQDSLGEADSFMFHPALLDGSCVGAGAHFTQLAEDRRLFLPVYIESFCAAELIQANCMAVVKHSSVIQRDGLLSFTLAFFNRDGRQIGELKNITNKLVRGGEAEGPGQLLPRQPQEALPDVTEAAQSAAAAARRFLVSLIAERMDRDEKQIDVRAGYFEMGLDSASMLTLAQAVENRLGTAISPTLLFEYPTVERLAQYLGAAYPEQLRPEEPELSTNLPAADGGVWPVNSGAAEPAAHASARGDDIAVIGMAGRYPSAANLEQFWANLTAGKDCIREVPSSRWKSERLAGLRSASGKPMSRWGGFIDDPDCFDPQFFRITPREAETLDPQERLFLETCWETIEDAGYTPDSLAVPAGPHQRRRVGVFVGVMHKDYALLGAEAAAQGHPFPLSLNYAPIANRVSYVCNFHGPSMAVDTVCSSSLTAVHLAMESIRSGDCEAALAGGVNLSLHPAKYATYGMMDMQASDGRCRTFGSGGDGYVSGEGVGAVLLKPLSKAIADGDHIYAVLKGSMINHGGSASGITVPNPVAHADLIGECLQKAGVGARSVSYIEAHGTGTPLGDPIEMEGLVRAFRSHTDDTQFCSVGSVKSNIGHAESAAGICGLQKVILQLYHRMLVPSLHAEELNPYIDFERSPFYVQRKLAAWERPVVTDKGKEISLPLRAGISSFGATGSNAHLLLEEYDPAAHAAGTVPVNPPLGENGQCPALVLLSAKNKERLHAYAGKLAGYLQPDSDYRAVDLHALAYTLQVGREAMEERAAFLVRDLPELVAGLRLLAVGEESTGSVWLGRSGFDAAEDRLVPEAAAESLASAAAAWVHGREVDWKRMYGESVPLRLSLPSYPFAKERYWVPVSGHPAGARLSASSLLHPLLHENVSDFREQRFRTVFTGSEFFLADHIVNGQRMLPATAYLEMVRAAVAMSAGEMPEGPLRIRLKHIVWSNPFIAGEGTASVDIALFPETDNEITFDIFSHAPGEEPVVYCQGTAVIASGTVEAARMDLDRVRSECAEDSLDAPALYGLFRSMGTEYGAAHRGVDRLQLGEGQALARLTLPAEAAASEAYVLHPSSMDAALQACIGLAPAAGAAGAAGKPLVPFALEELVIHGACTERMWVWTRYSPGSGTGSPLLKYDLDLCDDQGSMLVQLKGLSVRPLELETLTGTKTEPASTLLLHKEWEERPAAFAHSLSGPDVKHLVVLSGQEAFDLAALRANLDGAECVQFPHEEEGTAARYRRAAAALLEHLQRIGPSSPAERLLIQLAVPNQGELRLYAGLFGMLKTMQLENTALAVQLIELEPGDSAGSLAYKLKQDSTDLEYEHIRYEHGKRHVAIRQAVDISGGDAPHSLPWKDGGVYLITGGAGGLGLIISREIAHSVTAPSIILAGRSELDKAKEAELDELRRSGTRVCYVKTDVSDFTAVCSLMNSIRSEYGTLNGIVHSAGLVRDRMLMHKTAAELQEVLAPKVDGLVHLDEASTGFPLDFVIAFSSAAGSLGNSGQADYAAANAFMDAYAGFRNTLYQSGKRNGRMLSVGWPLWAEGGMRLEAQAETALLGSKGLIPLLTASGIRALYRAWAAQKDHVLVLEGDAARMLDIDKQQSATWEQQTGAGADGTLAEIDVLYGFAVRYLTRLLAEVTKLPVSRIDDVTSLEEYGMDSIVAMQLTAEMEKGFGTLPKTLFFEYRNLQELAAYLTKAYPGRISALSGEPAGLKETAAAKVPAETAKDGTVKRLTPRSRPSGRLHRGNSEDTAAEAAGLPAAAKDIAIIGLSGRYPGAWDLEEFWQVLKDGRDCITGIPAARWDNSRHRKGSEGRNAERWGGFIDGVDEFDPLFFNISPREAEMMDPQERLFLERVYEAMEDAGYVRLTGGASAPYHTGSVGVYVGVMYEEYQLYGVREQIQGKAVALSGNSASIANRVSYYCNFQGPSMAVATMCSSSLTAIHLACQSLRLGECKMAVAGGVNVSVHPNKYILLEQNQFVSSKGRCESFGIGGDGYVPGEGVGAVLLKPLDQAIADGDPIYGVIKGTAVNHGGKVNGYTVPNPNAQAEVIGKALREAGLDARELTYIEAHGTGTSLGDPIEIAGLAKCFGTYTQDKQFCAIGSVKSNIGHSESAAGIAGLTKVLLQLQHKQLVPSLHSEVLNPNIDFTNTPFTVQRELAEWPRPLLNLDGTAKEHRRTAGLSSFGAGGSNAHIIIQEYVPAGTEAMYGESAGTPVHPALILLSARDEERLREQAKRLVEAIRCKGLSDTDLPHLAYTLQVGREAMEERLALAAVTMADAVQKLTAYAENPAAASLDIYRDGIRRNKEMMALLAQDEDMAAAVDHWMAKGKWNKLLGLWVRGGAVEWSRLYTGSGFLPRRLRLPSYPFARERYWVAGGQEHADVSGGSAGQAYLHPLLHVNTSDLAEQRYTSLFTGAEFYLEDHVVNGQSMLPAAALLEMARAAVEDAAAGVTDEPTAIRLSGVTWPRPLIAGTQPVQVHIGLHPGERDEIMFDIYGDGEDGSAPVYSSGRAELYAVEDAPHLDLDALYAACSGQQFDAGTVYESFRLRGIGYGPGHRGIERLHTGRGQVLAELTLPDFLAGTEDTYMLHPSLLDSALQASAGLRLAEADAGKAADAQGLYLPFALEELEVTGACASRMVAHVRYSDGSPADGSADKFDIDLCDRSGKVCARLKGFTVRKTGPEALRLLEEGAAASESKPQMQTLSLLPVWDAVKPEMRQDNTRDGEGLLVVGTPGVIRDRVMQHFAGATLMELMGGETADMIAQRLQAQGPVRHVVWIAPQNTIESPADEAWIGEQERGVLQVFRLIKAFLQLKYGGQPLEWTLVTVQSQPIHSCDPLKTAHAGVHGLAGSMAKEYPGWQIRAVDLEAGREFPVEDMFRLPAEPQGNSWVYRTGEWHKQKLVPIQEAASEPTLFQEGGVYVVIGGAGGIGQAWSEYMIRTYQANVIWIGRREKDSGIQAGIDRLAALGPAPGYITADAADLQSFQRAYLEIKQRYSRINGIVHAALVLRDQLLANMDEERFQAALAAKVDVSVRIGQVFRDEPLDFVLFFSSINAFARSAGQSNYSAGCAFKDAYASYLAGVWPCAVKVMNWGYWGSVGAVASREYSERMANRGIGSIEPPEAMAALESLLAGPVNQMALVRTANPGTMEMIDVRQAASVYSAQADASPGAGIFHHMAEDIQEGQTRQAKALSSPAARELEQLIVRLLLKQLRTTAAPLANGRLERQAMFGKWLEASVQLLAEHAGVSDPLNELPEEETAALWQEWSGRRQEWLDTEGLEAQVILAETMLRALPDILTGQRPATDVMFPNSSMHLVEGIYKNNPHADYFNGVLAGTAVAYVEQRIRHNPSAKIRILEIGAGTGGTSSGVLRKLEPYRDRIQEYAYTDLSRAFLQHAEKEYGPRYPYLAYGIFNAENGIQEQGYAAGVYDVVIAANALHATRDIRTALRNAKALLRSGGILLLNEITRSDLFTHITFGLLEGWWAYEDAALRAPGCPGLAPDTWQAVLAGEGFGRIIFPAGAAHDKGQQIIAAHSDGIARQRLQAQPDGSPKVHKEVKAIHAAAKVEAVSFQRNQPAAAAEAADTRVPEEELRARSRSYFKRLIGDVLRLPDHRIDASEPFESYGIDSILVVQLTDSLRGVLPSVSSTLFFEHRTIDSLVEHFILTQEDGLRKLVGMENGIAVAAGLPEASAAGPGAGSAPSVHSAPLRPPTASLMTKRRFVSRTATEPESIPRPVSNSESKPSYVQDVAVIGLSGRFPMAGGVNEFWENVKQGRSCISEIPPQRWDWRSYYNEEKGKSGSMYTRWGGFLEDIDAFDPMFFRISPKEAAQMDPQERLFLESAYASVEDAGYTPANLSTSRKVGVFAGVMNGSYPTGASYWSIANRVSYLLNFQGPSMAVDTACSSSLTAVHLALESLYSGMSECAVVGGVNLIADPVHYLKLSAATMLSPGDTCRAFGAGADGFVDGETVCTVVLKPLEAALADGDHIYGVLKGSALNAGGRTNGYTVPSPDAQRGAVSEALRRSGVPARTVTYVEAHGTGTALGDPIEISGLTKAYERETSDKQFCAIGSVKSNIGHTESASGMAGLAKVLLQLKHRKIAPTLHAQETNPDITFGETPFFVQQELGEWQRPTVELGGIRREFPRRAGISSFGAGGANAHLIVEEFVPEVRSERPAAAAPGRPFLIVLSARNGDRLKERVQRLLAAAETNGYSDADLADIAYTLQVGREEMEERLAFTALSMADLHLRLHEYLRGDGYQPELHHGHVKANQEVLAALTADEDMQETVDKWIRHGKFAKLLDLWVKGFRLDWSGLYDGLPAKPRRISLPTYPFARERYWMEGSPFPAAPAMDTAGAQLVLPKNSQAERPNRHPAPQEQDEPMIFEEIWEEETGAEMPAAGQVQLETVVCFLSDRRSQQILSNAVRLSSPTARIVFVSEQPDGGERLEDTYRARGDDSASLADAFRDIAVKYGNADALLYMWPLENPQHIQDPSALVHTIQALASTKFEVRKLIAAAAFANGLERCYAESWIGIQRSLGNVLPDTSMGVWLAEAGLHGQDAGMKDWLEQIGAELRSSSVRNVLYVEGKRNVCTVRRATDHVCVQPVWKKGGTYLITGGCGGLGYLFAEHAARTHGVQLILTGRSAVDDTIKKKLGTLEALGSSVEYVQADLCNLPRMQEGIARAKARFGPINGVIHAAGIQVNRSVMEKSAEEFRQVLLPKTEGTAILDELLLEEPLDFFCLFSSTSAVLGDFGSCDYAAANRFQMAYADYRNALRKQGLRRGHTAAVGWPLWRDGGMGFSEEEQSGMYLKASGQRYLEAEEGLAVFSDLISRAGGRYLVLAGDSRRIGRFLGTGTSSADFVPASFVRSGSSAEYAQGPLRLEEYMERDLKNHIGSLLSIPLNKLDSGENLVDYGFDSISLTQFARLLAKQYEIDFGPSLFYAYPTIEKLKEYLLTGHENAVRSYYLRAEEADVQASLEPVVNEVSGEVSGEQKSALVSESSGSPQPEAQVSKGASTAGIPEPVAIIGMSGRFPGASDIDTFWSNLVTETSAISEIPSERWDWRKYSGDPRKEPGTSVSRWGGFIPDIDRFDPLFFEISPKEAELMDPQQRLFLEEAWHALEDAGYMGERIRGKLCGVYVGAEESQYADVTGGEGQISSNQNATLSARIAYKLDLKGPNFTLTASCSSGLVAVHQACLALRSGDCDMAVAGGVSLTVSPRMYAGLGKANMLSPDGTCSVFDGRANGLVPGEAAAVVVLKPLSKAIADNDRIYGTIKASGVNYDGQTNGISAPNPLSQEQLIKQIYERSGIRPEQIGFLMAHSVGAKIGDSIEMEALSSAFRKLSDVKGHCAVGSVKPLIGHTFAASGVVSLIAMVTALHRKTIVPVSGFESLSELISFKESPFYIAQEVREWTSRPGQARLGAVSTTGISGTNAHAVIEEYIPSLTEPQGECPSPAAYAVILSAQNDERLQAAARQLADYMDSGRSADVALRDLAYTLSVGREAMKCRLAIVTPSKEALVQGLSAYIDGTAATLPGGLAIYGGSSGTHGHQTPASATAGTAGKAVRERDLLQLASLWAGGMQVPWAELYEAGSARIVSAPGYPFRRRKCWPQENRNISVQHMAGSLPPSGPDGGNKAAELYSFNTVDRSAEFQEEYLTFCPFESRIPGFSMSRVMLNPERYPDEAALVKDKQIELRQVLFYKADFRRVRSVLDIGCGHGTDVIQIASLYPDIQAHGYTISKGQAELGNKRIEGLNLSSRAAIYHRDSTVDRFPDCYDLVIGIEVCCHIPDKTALFANIAASLAEDGQVLLMDFIANLRGPIVDADIGIAIATAAEWAGVLAHCGLAIEEIIDVSSRVANYLYDPDCERNTEGLVPVARDSLRSYANNAISLERGWTSYCLFKLCKETAMTEAELKSFNEIRIAHKTPYAEALNEMKHLGQKSYPPASITQQERPLKGAIL